MVQNIFVGFMILIVIGAVIFCWKLDNGGAEDNTHENNQGNVQEHNREDKPEDNREDKPEDNPEDNHEDSLKNNHERKGN